MARILAFVTGPGGRDADMVTGVAAALAAAVHATVDQQALPPAEQRAAAAVLSAVRDDDVALAVLPYSPGRPARLVTDVIQRCSRPVVVVPVARGAPAPKPISRILVPLNGTVETAQAVEATVSMFAACGADIVVLHVFDETVPRFWDQPVHARKSWGEAFLARYWSQPDVRIELRVGNPGEHILDVAASEHADLIALGWACRLSPGRARTVRSTLAQVRIPVLLLPVSSRDPDDDSLVDAPAGDLLPG